LLRAAVRTANEASQLRLKQARPEKRESTARPERLENMARPEKLESRGRLEKVEKLASKAKGVDQSFHCPNAWPL
jgi:hypothetical protein